MSHVAYGGYIILHNARCLKCVAFYNARTYNGIRIRFFRTSGYRTNPLLSRQLGDEKRATEHFGSLVPVNAVDNAYLLRRHDKRSPHLTPNTVAAKKRKTFSPSHLCSYTPPYSFPSFCATGGFRRERANGRRRRPRPVRPEKKGQGAAGKHAPRQTF